VVLQTISDEECGPFSEFLLKGLGYRIIESDIGHPKHKMYVIFICHNYRLRQVDVAVHFEDERPHFRGIIINVDCFYFRILLIDTDKWFLILLTHSRLKKLIVVGGDDEGEI